MYVVARPGGVRSGAARDDDRKRTIIIGARVRGAKIGSRIYNVDHGSRPSGRDAAIPDTSSVPYPGIIFRRVYYVVGGGVRRGGRGGREEQHG